MNKLDVRKAWRLYYDLVQLGFAREYARELAVAKLRRNREKFLSMGGAL